MLHALEKLKDALIEAGSISAKVELLDRIPEVLLFLQQKELGALVQDLPLELQCVFKQIIAIGKAGKIFSGPILQLREVLEKLWVVDQFYREIGGLVGYQLQVERLLQIRGVKKDVPLDQNYLSPHFFSIEEESEETRDACLWGIESLDLMAEIYPLGGAADRLHLMDEKTGLELPAAKLPFGGRSLLECLIRDLQARERLYFQKFGKSLITPIAIMTSHEKNNHAYVLDICKKNNWFGRGAHSFRFFTQPLVPTVHESGEWCVNGEGNPILKPGGHGVLWKLARDEGIFSWLKGLGRKKALIRQINNPIAGLDYGLLAFTGIGCKKEMLFGFASCPRLLQAAEGVNVLIERKKGDRSEIVLTNIEYCDFAKFGIEDKPLKEGEPYSRFSSNTNILFADLEAIEAAVQIEPFPGLLVNLKNGIARLESTMQNIADVFVEQKEPNASLVPERTFVTYNQRHKTISTAKKVYVPGNAPRETPENCFYDLLSAHRELLEKYCGFSLPPKRTFEEALQQGPEFLFMYHPALGPLYSLIGSKLKQGSLSIGSELILEIAEVKLSNLSLQGSLRVVAEQIMGHFEQEILTYSDRVSRCILNNVVIENRGVDWEKARDFWKMNLPRFESVQIILKGQSTFIAENVRLRGNHLFIVEDGYEMRLFEKNGVVEVSTTPKV